MPFDFPQALREHAAYADKGLHRGTSEGDNGEQTGCDLCTKAAEYIESLELRIDVLELTLEQAAKELKAAKDTPPDSDFEKPGPVARDPLTEEWHPFTKQAVKDDYVEGDTVQSKCAKCGEPENDRIHHFSPMDDWAPCTAHDFVEPTQKAQSEVDVERELSEAYIRLRKIIPDSFRTPHAPTPQQVWAHTELCATLLLERALKAERLLTEASQQAKRSYTDEEVEAALDRFCAGPYGHRYGEFVKSARGEALHMMRRALEPESKGGRMIAGRYADSIVVTDDGNSTPISYDDRAAVLAAMEKRESTVVVQRVGYHGESQGRVWLSVPRILRVEENADRGRF